MKFQLFSTASILLVCLLNIIDIGSFGHWRNTSTNVSIIAVVSFAGLFLFLLMAFYQFKRKLTGDLIFRAINRNISDRMKFLIVLSVILILSIRSNIFQLTYSQYYIVLIVFALYEWICKWHIRVSRPEMLSLSSDSIEQRSTTGIKRRSLSGLVKFYYNNGDKSLVLQFEDGLDTLKIYLSDFTKEDLLVLCDGISKYTNKELIVQDSEVITELLKG